MKIRIVRVPEGSPPLWVRQASVELVLTCFDGLQVAPLLGIAGGQPSPANIRGYQVLLFDLVAALRQAGEHGAAKWWEDESQLTLDTVIQYGALSCEVVRSGE